MNSTNELLDRIGDPTLSTDQKVALRYDLAKYLEQCWNFEAAEEAMGQLWQRLGECPVLAEIAMDAGDPERTGLFILQALLCSCAYPVRPDWSTFNLKEVQLRNECRYVEQALEDANGSVTKAAELLGLASHQSLLYMLNGRLKNRISARTPIKRRRRSVMSK